MSEHKPSRRTFLKTTGILAATSISSVVPASAETDISNAPVPENENELTYATMGTDITNPTATVYGNFKCPYTQKFVRDGNLEAVLNEYVATGDLNVRFRALAYQPPGTTSHGSSTYYISDSDPLISEATLGVWDVSPTDYWEFFNYMFSDLISGNVSFSEMQDRMQATGVSDRTTIIDRASSGRYDDTVEETRYPAGDYGVSFTPTMVLNGETIAPHHDVDTLLEWIGDRIPEVTLSTDTLSNNQPNSDVWHQVDSNAQSSRVVIAKPLSYNGPHPAHIRLRNSTDGNFEYKIEEWEYLDGSHTNETFHTLATTPGDHELLLSDGSQYRVQAGNIVASDSPVTGSFDTVFGSEIPVVFAQSQTYNGHQPIVTRIANVSTDSFTARVQEEDEIQSGGHLDETIGYIALQEATGQLNGKLFEVHRTDNLVTEEWYRITFDREYTSPQFICDMQTFNGINTANIRYKNLTADSVMIKVEEEESEDSETIHDYGEIVGYAVFDAE